MKFVTYDTWNEMLNARDDIHEDYIRNYDGGSKWEVVHYSKWNKDTYFAFSGFSATTLEAVIENQKTCGYDSSTMDICIAKNI